MSDIYISMNNGIFKKIYYFIIPFLILGITFGYSSFAVSIIALIPLFFSANKHTVGLFFLMYGGTLGGVTRAVYPFIPVYGYLLEFIGILLLWDLLVDLFSKHFSSVIAIVLVLLAFGFFYFIGPMDSFAKDKYSGMWETGLIMLLGYYALNKLEDIEVDVLTDMLLIDSICLFAFVITTDKLNPGGLFDYDWFRNQTLEVFYANKGEHSLIGYQHIGLLILFGASIYFSQARLTKFGAIFYAVCSMQLVLMSGCRQAIFGLIMVLALRFAYFRVDLLDKKKPITNTLWVIVGSVVAYFVISIFLNSISSENISSVLQSGDSGRELLYLQAISVFQNHQLLGAGIGGFHAITGEVWPHNFFLELLCECGLLGTVLFVMILILSLVRKKIGMRHMTASNLYFFLIVFALFFRLMVSADFKESIALFSAVFAVMQILSPKVINRNTTV